uniref:Isoform 2 of Putative microRNA 17 host gene protein n=1 Tax=Homo sapiens TaxID=9606 RepID=Q75NE6-2|nr:chromosome 13 open reading frame 25 variant 1 [Homo sapiens]
MFCHVDVKISSKRQTCLTTSQTWVFSCSLKTH